MTEYVTVQELPRAEGFDGFRRAPCELSLAPGTASDFTVGDATVRLQDPRVFINGGFEASSARTLADEAGATVWIYIPSRGRFLFSLVPNAQHGFRRAGAIRGSSLRFEAGGNVYSINSASAIVPGVSPYNLYVLHQPEWRPNYPNANVDATMIGAAQRVEDALGR